MMNETLAIAREHDRARLVQRLDELVADLRGHGVPISEASRIVQYARTLGGSFEIPRMEPSRLILLSHCYSEGSEILEVTGHLRASPEVPGWRKLFQRVQKGDVMSSAKPDDARAAQFELVVGSVLRAAGALVEFREVNAAKFLVLAVIVCERLESVDCFWPNSRIIVNGCYRLRNVDNR